MLKTILQRIDAKLHARCQARIEPQKVSRLTKEDNLDTEAIHFYHHYRPADCIRRIDHNGVTVAIDTVYVYVVVVVVAVVYLSIVIPVTTATISMMMKSIIMQTRFIDSLVYSSMTMLPSIFVDHVESSLVPI